MNRLGSFADRFKQLRWKLMLSYTSVTLGVLLVVGLVAMAAGYLWFSNQLRFGDLMPGLIKAAGIEFVNDLQPMLSQNPPAQDDIHNWLDRTENRAIPILLEGDVPLAINAGELQVMVLDSGGLLLGKTSRSLLPDSQLGESLDTLEMPQLAASLQNALSGEINPGNWEELRLPEEKIVGVMPVWNLEGNQVLGVIVTSATIPTVYSMFSDSLASLPLILAFLILVAGILGTVFGLIAGRGLTRRLKRLYDASQAWSEGNFSVYVDDSSGDELGQLAQRLNRMAQELENLLDTRRELVVLEERNRLARDLHDSVKQQAFAASAQINTAKRLLGVDVDRAKDHIEEAEGLTDNLRQELTNLIQELRPPALEGKGLAAALSDYCQEWSRQNEIELELRLKGERPLPLEIEQAVFRIVQESLANVTRHSDAEVVEVRLVYNTDGLDCTIRDNGRGFDLNVTELGVGIRSMQERARRLGSQLRLESEPGKGASIKFTVKLNAFSEHKE